MSADEKTNPGNTPPSPQPTEALVPLALLRSIETSLVEVRKLPMEMDALRKMVHSDHREIFLSIARHERELAELRNRVAQLEVDLYPPTERNPQPQ